MTYLSVLRKVAVNNGVPRFDCLVFPLPLFQVKLTGAVMMRRMSSVTCLALLLSAAATGQTVSLGDVAGIVSIGHPDGSVVAAFTGMPVREGDFVNVESGSRATLLSADNVLRLNWDTRVEVLASAPDSFRFRLRRGSMAADLTLAAGGSGTVDTPAGPVTMQASGAYRIDADPARNAVRLNVHSGHGLLGGLLVNAGQCGEWTAGGIADLREVASRGGFDSANWVWPVPGHLLNPVAAHEANLSKAAEIVDQANHPDSGTQRILAPVHVLITPTAGAVPHSPVLIGLPRSGVVR